MKRYIQSSVILLAAIALAGCAKTEQFQCNPDSTLQIESVSGISPFSLMQEPASKAVITGETLPGDEAAKGIGLFVTAQGGGAYDGKTEGYSNVKFTYGGAKWSAASPVYLSNTTGKLYGYFPYSADATDLTAIPVESSLNGTDYLYATPQEVSFSNKSVSLQMNHALARLHLTIKKGDKYPSDCNLSKIVLQSKAIDANGTMDITTGAVTATKAADATGTFALTGSDAVTSTGITKDILLVPAGNTEGKKDLTLILTIDGAEAKVNFTGGSGLDIRSGIQCNATIEIQDTGIKVTGVGVGTWGDGGGQTVQVSGHTVTVKLAEEQLPDLANDLIFTPKIIGDAKVKIEVYPKSQKRLECYLNAEASCDKNTQKNSNYYVFTISNIASDVTVTIGYPRPAEIKLSYSSLTAYVGESFILSTTVLPDDAVNKNLIWHSTNSSVATVDINGRITAKSEGAADIIAKTEVGGITATCAVTVNPFEELIISGKFSVGSSKQIHFSRGNLYYDGNRFCIEEHQYDTTPTSETERDNNHISHFFWCDNASNAMALKYNGGWNGENKSFFAASDFTVNGFSGWSMLTGGTGGEWEYLLGTRETAYGTNRRYAAVKVNGMAGLLIFPDDFSSWPSGAGDEPTTFNTNSNNWNDKNYTVEQFNTLQNNGCVFLPAVGFRNGDPGYPDPAYVLNVGNDGYYWSASPYGDGLAFDSYFDSGSVFLDHKVVRTMANSVRLVTEAK